MKPETTVQKSFDPEQVQLLIAPVKTAIQELILHGDTRVKKALDVGQGLLDTIEGEGMSQALDLDVQNYLGKLKKLQEDLGAKRAPVTKAFDEIRSQFTALEALVENAKPKPGTLADKLIQYRNQWATEKLAEQRKKELEALHKQGKETEGAVLVGKINTVLVGVLARRIEEQTLLMRQLFNSSTLETLGKNVTKIRNWVSVYEPISPKQIQMAGHYHTAQEIDLMIKDILEVRFSEDAAAYYEQLTETSHDLMEQENSKMLSLEAIAAANKKEKARLIKEAEDRQKAAEEAAAAALEAKAAQAAADIKTNTEVAQAEINFQTLVDTTPDVPLNVKEDFIIEAESVAAWMKLAMYWFENDARTMALGDLEKKLGFMKKAAEKAYNATGLKIDYPGIKYVPVVKATKQKA
jgi:hypothetical protein